MGWVGSWLNIKVISKLPMTRVHFVAFFEVYVAGSSANMNLRILVIAACILAIASLDGSMIVRYCGALVE